MGFSRQKYWSRLPYPPPGDLPDLGIELTSFMSPALAGRFFTASATWEALRRKHRRQTFCNTIRRCSKMLWLISLFRKIRTVLSDYSCRTTNSSSLPTEITLQGTRQVLEESLGFPDGANGRDPPCQCRRHKRCGLDP